MDTPDGDARITDYRILRLALLANRLYNRTVIIHKMLNSNSSYALRKKSDYFREYETTKSYLFMLNDFLNSIGFSMKRDFPCKPIKFENGPVIHEPYVNLSLNSYDGFDKMELEEFKDFISKLNSPNEDFYFQQDI